jgi:hypothetical protein
MNESIAKLKQAYPDMVVNLIRQTATEAFYDWTSKANGHRHHIVRWIAAGGDIHLISYESTGVKLEKEMRDRWVEMIARVQFAQTARR